MSGRRDLAAAEAAELAALRRGADRKREELGETIQVLSARFGHPSLRRWAVGGLERVAARAWHSAGHAIRQGVPGNGTVVNGAVAVTSGARRLGRTRAGKAALIAAPAGLVAVAVAAALTRRGALPASATAGHRVWRARRLRPAFRPRPRR